jgi:inosose dehydratase
MERPTALTRRDLVRLGVSALALSPLTGGLAATRVLAADPTPNADPFLGLRVGVATYTFSRVPLEKTIRDIKQVGVQYVSIKEAHLPLKSTAEQRKEVVKKFKEAGITPLSCGNIAMKDDESAVRNAFEYARDAGIPTIVCTPVPQILPLLDKLVKKFDIKLAIHNHGPEDKLWPSPYTIWEAVQKYDERIGLCIYVGHTARTGVDPAESIKRCAGRLYDVHLKDIATSEVGSKSSPVEVGRGVLNIHKILGNLLDINFRGLVGLKYEKDMNDPLAGVAESIGYVRGVLSDMKRA